MITFYECLQEYYKREDAIKFSNKQVKRMSGYCKYVFDSRENSKITYTKSKEGDEVFTVRSYPDSFKRVIMETIEKAHNHQKSLKEIVTTQEKSVPTIDDVVNQVKPFIKKERKRIPIIKPAYSAKPKLDI